MDTIPPKKMRPKKFISREDKDGTRYYKKAGYICEACPYADNAVCGNCMFARWNVDGIRAGFSPDAAFRKAHGGDLSASPLIETWVKEKQSLTLKLPAVAVPSYNRLQELTRRLERGY